MGFYFSKSECTEQECLVSLSIQLVCIGKLVEKFTLLKLFITEEFFSNVEKTALAAVVEFNLRHSAVQWAVLMVKLIYSDKATKIWFIFHFYLTSFGSQIKWKMGQISSHKLGTESIKKRAES